MSEVFTKCEKCVFATWIGNTQKGCELGQLAKISLAGIKTENCEENGKLFTKINDIICPKYIPSHMSHLKEKLLELLKLRMDIVVLHNNDTIKLESTLKSINKQTYKPNNIIIVTNEIKVEDDVVQLRNKYLAQKGIKSFIVMCNKLPNIEEQIKQGSTKVSGNYFMIVHAGYTIKKDYIHQIDVFLHDKFKKFVMINPPKLSGTVVQTYMYRLLAQMHATHILEDLKKTGELEQNKKLIISSKELWE